MNGKKAKIARRVAKRLAGSGESEAMVRTIVKNNPYGKRGSDGKVTQVKRNTLMYKGYRRAYKIVKDEL